MTESLGTNDGLDSSKTKFLIYVLLVIFIMWLGSIGANPTSKNLIYFYVGLTVLLFIIPFGVDQLSKTSEYLDTVTIEKPRMAFLGVPTQVAIGLALSLFTVWRATTTQIVWVPAPQFNIFDSKIGNAVLDGLGGSLEPIVFFSVIFPTAYIYIRKRSNALVAFAGAALITSFVFMGSHWLWRYRTDEVALAATFEYAFVQCALVMLFRSVLIPIMMQFSNDFALSMGWADKYSLSIAI